MLSYLAREPLVDNTRITSVPYSICNFFFNVGAGDLNSGPYTCMLNTYPTELSLQS